MEMERELIHAANAKKMKKIPKRGVVEIVSGIIFSMSANQNQNLVKTIGDDKIKYFKPVITDIQRKFLPKKTSIISRLDSFA